MLNVATFVQEFASVTVQVQLPAVNPVTEFVPSPVGFPGIQLYVNVPVPPLAVTDAAPLLPPLQEMFVCDEGVTVIAEGCVTLNVAVFVQEFASVTVQVRR